MRHSSKNKKRLSPILDQILYGPPSVSLNLAHGSSMASADKQLFACNTLNYCYIFKYPNFDVELSETVSGGLFDSDLLAKERPVETAIFLPSDWNHPDQGGYAVYLRQKNADYLLQRHFGLKRSRGRPSTGCDLEKLAILDSIPSLDPFLIKTTFDSRRLSLDPAYMSLSHSIEQRIKLRISERVRPIVERAVGVRFDKRGGNERKFVDAIWDPSLPEAQLFIEAFKIDARVSPLIFSAWKGLAFYEQQFSEHAPHVGRFVKWLKSNVSEPYDIRQNRVYKEQIDMFKLSVIRKITNMINNIRSIFTDFNSAYSAFILDSNPIPFRSYLISADKRYWVLGYCCTAIANTINIFDRAMLESVNGRVSFDKLNDILYFVDSCVSSRANLSASEI